MPNPDACYANCFVKFRPTSCGKNNPDPYGCLCKDQTGVQGCIAKFSKTNMANQAVVDMCKMKIGHACGDDQRFVGKLNAHKIIIYI